MTSFRLLVAAVLLSTALPATAATERRNHYVVFAQDEAGRPALVFHQVSSPVADVPPALRVSGPSHPVHVLLVGPDGRLLASADPRPVTELRGEFHSRDDGSPRLTGTIESHFLVRDRPAWLVRATAPDGSRLLVGKDDPVPLLLDATPAGDQRHHAKLLASTGSGDPDNRVDLVILGDGYTEAQQADFLADAGALEASFFDVTPYADYTGFFNVSTVFVPSREAGSDHPPYLAACASSDPSCCSDTDARNDPLAGTYVDTALDGRFCTQGIHRLLTVDTSKVVRAAAAVPEWDAILVVVNDDTYGGSGGLFAVVSTHEAVVDVARHEWGHTFTELADEYESPYPGYPSCSDLTGPTCEANVTDETRREHLKWTQWVDASTPLPTPETGGYDHVVGLFEGARYQTSDIYRPRQACLMRQLDARFCEVCAQEYVLVLYRGGWGRPSDGIDLIEPGSESPAPGPVTSGDAGIELSVAVATPSPRHTPTVSWWVDGVPVEDEDGPSFTFRPQSAGAYRVEVRVSDPTPLVHENAAAGLLTSSRSWTVTRTVSTRRPAGRVAPSRP